MTVVWAGMATLPERAGSRAMAIDSLLPQVDRMIVSNGTETGDAAKFAAAANAPDVFITVDDDLIYPPDYVDRLLAGLDQHPGSIVSFHGYTLDREGSIVGSYPCTQEVDEDTEVHIAGTGVCAFRTEHLRPVLAAFRSKNAADIWFALLAEQHNVPRIVLAHDHHWLGYTEWPRTIALETSAKTGSSFDGSQGRNEAIRELLAVAAVTVYPVRHSHIAAPTKDHIAASLATGEYYEPDLLAALQAPAKDKVVIDVGAHVGNHAAYFVGEAGARRVIAIEPNPVAFRLLKRTVQLSGRTNQIMCHHAAVHPEWGSVEVIPGPDGNLGMARVEPGGKIPTVRLDSFNDQRDVAVVKIDVEGLAGDVLRSGLTLLANHRPLVAVEDAGQEAEIAAVIGPLGYRQTGPAYGSTSTHIWRS